MWSFFGRHKNGNPITNKTETKRKVKYWEVWGNMKAAYEQARLINYVLAIVLILVSISLFNVSREKTIVVGLTGIGAPVYLPIEGYNLSSVRSVKNFTRTFIYYIGTFNYRTFLVHFNNAKNLMAPDLVGVFTKQIGGIKNFIEYLKQNNITQVCNVIGINVKKNTPKGYLVTVVAEKTRADNLMIRTTYSTYKLTVMPTDITKKNAWGLEVTSIIERERKGVGKD